MAITEVKAGQVSNTTKRRITDSKYFFPFLLFVIVVCFYWKLTLSTQFDWIWGPDLAQQVIPWLEEEARQLQHSLLPLWDPHTWAGQPMLGQAQPGTAYPLNWILFLMPRVDGHIAPVVLQWYYVIIHYMAALFSFLLCRDLGRSRAASLIGGLIFGMTAYVGTTDWPQMVNGAIWAPMVFLFLLRAVRGLRPVVNAALCGTCLGMAWLAGHHQMPIYITLAMSGTWIFYILRKGSIDWNIAKLAAIALIFMVLVGALQILPAQEYGHLAKRWAGADHELTWDEPVPYYVHREYSMYPMSLFGILVPALNRHADPFIGVVAFSLGILAIALLWKSPMVKLFATLALGAILYSLGHNSVFHGLIYAIVPLVEKARVPSMAVVIWGMAVAVLAAFGVDHFTVDRDSLWTRMMPKIVVGFSAALYFIIFGVLMSKKSGWEIDDRVAITALVALLLAALLQAWRCRSLTARTCIVLLTLLMLFELGQVSGYTFADRGDKDRQSYRAKVVNYPEIGGYLNQQPKPFRIETETEELVPNWAGYHNFDVIKALCASVTSNLMELEWHTWQTRMLFGVRYTISEKPPLEDSKAVFNTNDGRLKVFENPTAFPRAWSVHEIIPIKTPNEGRLFVNDHLQDLHFKAFTLEKMAPLQPCAGDDQVTVKKYNGESLLIDTTLQCDGMVVLSDIYYPGWQADVDGKRIDIHQVNSAMRGVLVPRGHHLIGFRYRPTSVYLGAFLTLLGWLGAAGLVVFGPRDNHPEDLTIA